MNISRSGLRISWVSSFSIGNPSWKGRSSFWELWLPSFRQSFLSFRLWGLSFIGQLMVESWSGSNFCSEVNSAPSEVRTLLIAPSFLVKVWTARSSPKQSRNRGLNLCGEGPHGGKVRECNGEGLHHMEKYLEATILIPIGWQGRSCNCCTFVDSRVLHVNKGSLVLLMLKIPLSRG